MWPAQRAMLTTIQAATLALDATNISQIGIRAKHLREGISNFQNCVQCHRSAHGEHGSGEQGKDD